MKKWEEEEIEIGIRLIKEGKTFIEIAEKLNRSCNSVRCYFNRLGYQTITNSIKHITCPECEGVFEKNEYSDGVRKQRRKFCSRSCSISHSNKNRKKKKELKQCLNCDNKCKNHESKYCCQNCQFEHQKKVLIENVKSGKVKLSSFLIKKALIIINGEKCMKCGWNERNEKTNKIPIELNHKDGNSENNSIENTELLCPNCHSLTPNYKALNKGKGRYKRKQRKAEGKSY